MYESVIRNRVLKALNEKEAEFEEAYKSASNKELLDYLRNCAVTLKHSPWPREIIGGRYIEKRFGTYKTALREAELPNPKHADLFENFSRVQEEVEIQKVAYRKKKAEKKERSAKRRAEQAKKRLRYNGKQTESVQTIKI